MPDKQSADVLLVPGLYQQGRSVLLLLGSAPHPQEVPAVLLSLLRRIESIRQLGGTKIVKEPLVEP